VIKHARPNLLFPISCILEKESCFTSQIHQNVRTKLFFIKKSHLQIGSATNHHPRVKNQSNSTFLPFLSRSSKKGNLDHPCGKKVGCPLLIHFIGPRYSWQTYSSEHFFRTVASMTSLDFVVTFQKAFQMTFFFF